MQDVDFQLFVVSKGNQLPLCLFICQGSVVIGWDVRAKVVYLSICAGADKEAEQRSAETNSLQSFVVGTKELGGGEASSAQASPQLRSWSTAFRGPWL